MQHGSAAWTETRGVVKRTDSSNVRGASKQGREQSNTEQVQFLPDPLPTAHLNFQPRRLGYVSGWCAVGVFGLLNDYFPRVVRQLFSGTNKGIEFMKRDEWLFEHTGSKLADAARSKKSLHESKKTWWEQKKNEVMAKVRESGIEVRDSVAACYSNTKGNYGPQIEVDAGLQRDLTECQHKILEHDRLIRDYEGWIQVLSANPEARLSLDHEDYLFFFGK